MSARVLIAAGAAMVATAANADVCSSLQQQYLAAGSNRATQSGPDIGALQRSLAVAQGTAQANHCLGFTFFGPPPAPFCPQIMSEVNRLQGQIQQASASGRGGFFGNVFNVSQGQADRSQLRGLLVSNGCPIPDGSGGYGGGGYRTICVRTCDGYYFPLEYNVSSSRFQADTQACQGMYGGAANAQLFVMPSDGDVASATPASGNGKAYGAQPYAFSYRTSFNPSCVAQLQSGVAALESSAVSTAPVKPGSTAPTVAATTSNGDPLAIPRLRPVRFEDPETAANASGGLRPTAVETVVAGGGWRPGIRVVGAGYYNQILEQQDARLLGQPVPSDSAPATATLN